MPGDPYEYESPYDNPAFRNPNGSFNWQKAGIANSAFNANGSNLTNINSFPGQNINPFSDPSGSGPNLNVNGMTSVDTASLTAFGNWVSTEVTEALNNLKAPLAGVQVEPGDFYWADYIRTYVNGTSSSTGQGLAAQLTTVIDDLLDGVAGISSGIKQLVQMYANTEDLNQAQATNLENDISNSFANASGKFNAVGNDSQSGNIMPQTG